MQLNNKNVVYIGGFGGIGFESCEYLIKNEISNLIVCDVKCDDEKLQKLQSLTTTTKVGYIEVDLTVPGSVECALEAAHKQLSVLDIVINGSGIMNEHQIERTIDINLMGVIRGSLAALKYMDKSQGGNGGVIVNVSSLVALDTYGAYAVYAASKYGVNGFTRSMSDPFYFARTNVTFITICPSTTETPMLEGLRQHKVTTFEAQPPLPATLQNNQTAAECGRNLIEAIKVGTNGSVWILSSGKLIEYKYTDVSHVADLN